MARFNTVWMMMMMMTMMGFMAAVNSQEVVNTPAKMLPDVTSEATDAEVELKFARGDAPLAKAKDVCAKLKAKPARISFGCEIAASLKDAKKVWEKNEESSAWEALSMLDEAKFGLEQTNALVDSIMEDALGSVKISFGKISFGKSSPGETTGRLMFACGHLTNCLKRTLTAEERVAVSEFLLSVSPATSGVALGLKALSEFGMASFTVKQDPKEQQATATSTTLTGKPVSWKLGKNTANIVSQAGNNGLKVQFDKTAGKMAKVPVEVELATGAKHTFNLEFEVNAEFSNAKLTIKEKSAVKSEQQFGAYPAKLDKIVSLETNQVMEITLRVTSGGANFCPEQAVFALRPEAAMSHAAVEYQVPSSCSETEVRVTITNSPKFAEDLKYQSGTYEIVFIASDDKMSNPTQWKLGSVKLSVSPPPEKKHEPLFTHSLLHESDTTLKPLPEIHHQFREPDRRAPWIISLAFTSLQVGLLVSLLVGLLAQGFNPVKIFKSFRLMFFAFTLTGIEALFFWYWLGPSGAPNMESLTYKYLPPVLLVLMFASKNVFGLSSTGSNKKTASM
jgi:hypothetical protein